MKKGFAKIWFIVGIVVIVATGFVVLKNGCWIGHEFHLNSNCGIGGYVNPVENISTTNSQTYSNTKYGFEFTYPSDYKVLENAVFDIQDKESKLQIIADKNPSFEKPRSFELYIKANHTLLDTISWYKKNFENVLVDKEIINGNNFTVIIFDVKDKSGGAKYHNRIMYIEHNGFLYSLDYSPDLKDSILTFKFTDNHELSVDDQSTTIATFSGYYTLIKGAYGEENTGPYDCDAFIVSKSDDPLFQFLAKWAPGTIDVNGNMRLVINISSTTKEKITKSTKDNPVSITVQKIKFEGKGLPVCSSVVRILSVN